MSTVCNTSEGVDDDPWSRPINNEHCCRKMDYATIFDKLQLWPFNIFFIIILLLSSCGASISEVHQNSSLSRPNRFELEPLDYGYTSRSSHNEKSGSEVNVKLEDEEYSSVVLKNDLVSDNIYRRDSDQNIADTNFGGLNLQSKAKLIGSHLRKLSNEELGVTAMQAIYDSLPFAAHSYKPEEQVKEITQKLQKKLKKYLHLLEVNRKAVEDLYHHHLSYPISAVNPCCEIPLSILRYDERFGTKVTKDTSCDTAPPSLPEGFFSPGSNLTHVFQNNLKDHPTIKWQYFISADGTHSEFPGHNQDRNEACRQGDDNRHRDVFLATVQPYMKHVIIVIDHGNSLSPLQLKTAKAVGKHILSQLSHNDKVGVMGLAGEVQYPQSDSCLAHNMAYAAYETKFHFSRFIDGLQKTQDATNHLLGFIKAFEMVHNTFNFTNSSSLNEVLIVYISRGLLSSLTDARPLFETIAEENMKSKSKIVINTYAMVDGGKPVMYEKTFLQDIAEQNFKKYNVQFPGPVKVKKGLMVSVNSTEDLAFTVGNFYAAFPIPSSSITTFSLPTWDPVGKSLVISFSKPVFHRHKLLGVVGLDMSLAELVEDITYFSHTPNNYAFLIEESGIALMHPFFSRPTFASEQLMHTDIRHLENRPGYHLLHQHIIRQHSGEKELTAEVAAESNKADSYLKQLPVYRWQKIEGTPYTVCVVSLEPVPEQRILKGSTTSLEINFIYHRLDLHPPRNLCRHMKQLSTLDASTLFLSAGSFLSPYEYLSQKETKQMVQSYMAYLIDTTKLIANPGLKSSVRNDVLAVGAITPEWKSIVQNSRFSKYIIRRYIATPSGVFQTYPGALVDKTYDPTKRDWYIQAMEHPGKVVLTAPYLDVGGAGYMVTVSHTVYEGKSAAMHSAKDSVMAVLGMDFTLGYFYKLLVDILPICEEDKIICFLLDDRGYLIAHPDLIEPNGRGPVEQQHITHKERLVANDMLNHKGFIKKVVCNSFSDRTVQRYYQFNTSLESILTNLVHGEHCAKYQIVVVPGSNVFLGIVNQTCDTVTAFCPCSMIDRLCLNCYRMEQTECECPCECPLEMNLCTGQLRHKEDRNPSCPHFPEEPRLPSIDISMLESLEPCFEIRCHTRISERDCFGVIGCEWCQLDSDGETPLKKKFCTDQRKCFGGILGARTPYADEIIGLPTEEFLTIKSTPVGPVAGGIMGCFVVLAIAFYCYRNHVCRGPSSHLIPHGQETSVRMSHLNNEPEDIEHHEESLNTVGHSNMALPPFESSSPYRVSTNYRRPPGGDSDHGYSTMTPHEDSEHMPYIEPFLIGKDRHRVPVSQQSVSSCSRTSSPVPHSHPHSVTPPMTYQLSSNLKCSPLTGGYPPWSLPMPTTRDPSQTIIPEVRQHSPHIRTQAQVHHCMVDTH